MNLAGVPKPAAIRRRVATTGNRAPAIEIAPGITKSAYADCGEGRETVTPAGTVMRIVSAMRTDDRSREKEAMRRAHTELYVHLVWATWDRLPLITAAIKDSLRAAVAAKCRELGAAPLAIGVVADHAHLLVRMPATLAVATLVKEVKGASSHLVTHALAPSTPFKWQGAYGAFSLAAEDVPAVTTYVAGQARHHAGGEVREEWELGADEAGA